MSSNGDQSSTLEGGNNRHACAACKHQRRKCEPSCPMAPHFPAIRKEEFQSVHDIFGVGNVKKLLEALDSLQDREAAVKSIKWEAAYWKQHPGQGPLGYIEQLEEDNRRLRQELQNRPPSIAVKIDQDNNNTSRVSSDARQESHEYNYNGDISSLDLDQVESSVVAQDNSVHEPFGHGTANEYYRFMQEENSNNACFSGIHNPTFCNNKIYPQFGHTNHGGDVYDCTRNDVMVDNAMAGRVLTDQIMEGRVGAENRSWVGDVIPDPPCYFLPLPQQNLDFLPDAGDHRTSRVLTGQVTEGRVGAHNGNVRVGDVFRGPPCYFFPLPPDVGDHRTRSLDDILKNANKDPNSQRRFK